MAKIIIGNFKMNTDIKDLSLYLEDFLPKIKERKTEVGLALPYTHLFLASQKLVSTNVKLGAQNVFYENNGAYTGEISPQMLKSISTDFVIIGHSERRILFNETNENIVLVGIKTRGVPLAERISEFIYNKIDSSKRIPVEKLDITNFRDDIDKRENDLTKSYMTEDIVGKTVVLVDDVIFTGRTIRAALDALTNVGRPSKIQLAVMVDRGHRELPIRPDYIGKNIPTSKNEIIQVSLSEIDGEDSIGIYEN